MRLNTKRLTKQMSEMMKLAAAEWATIPPWVHWRTLRGLVRRELIEVKWGQNQWRAHPCADQRPTMTFDQARAAMREFDPNLSENDPAFRCGVALILSTVHGPKFGTLSHITGYNRGELLRWASNWRRQKVWGRSRVTVSNWHDEKTGGIAFLCDINAGLGLLCRASSRH